MEVILIILAIIGTVSGLFKDKADSDTPIPKRKSNPPKPTPTPSGGDQSYSSPEDKADTQTTASAPSIEEQQDEQRKKLAERMNAMEHQDTRREHDAIVTRNRKPGTDLSAEHQRLRNSMNNNLTRTGLINGVIMSEVLGQPRAVKPYRSIVAQRKK
ncbi:hypothetical protein [Lentibacillus jeotgali]|uniref:hypothetical protein n=1 Tax=Lentibacillus jeotgali TaxID=558169 RepID=UPI0002626469|nr:hypothetical protein [Lentibacillus jeotgali]